jgi:anti-sigma B factor antagonist
VSLGVSTEAVPGGWLVEVSGEVDLHTAPQLRAVLGGLVERDSPGESVVVDLTGVSFIDSTGLGELVGAHKAVQRRGDRLHLVATNERVTRLLSLTGLDEVLHVHSDRFAALAAVQQS